MPVGGDSTYFDGFRFTNIQIPQNATIYQAYVEVYVPQSTWQTLNYKTYAENVGDSQAYSTSTPLNTRVPTQAVVPHFDNVNWPAGTWQRLEYATTSVQEVVNRSDWRSGNALSVILQGTGSAFKFVSTFDGSSLNAPRLVVSYALPTGPSPTPDPSSSDVPSPSSLPTVSPFVSPSPSATASPSPTLVPSPSASPVSSPNPMPSASSTLPIPKTVKLVARPNDALQNYFVFDGIVENGSAQTEVTSSRFSYTSGWTAYPNSGVNNSPVRYTLTQGSSVQFTTTATSLSFQTVLYPQTGSVDVYVNNVLQFTYNTNAPTLQYVNVPISI
jgi:hypothetical protein